MNIRLDIQYDGTNYKGWQKQPQAPSIQEEIEKTIYKVFHQKVNLVAAGRTDAGVHAYKQVANFSIETGVPADKIYYWLNSNLARDIRITRSLEVEDSFHARFDAKKKNYTYRIYNSKPSHPIYRNNFHFVYNKLDIGAMVEASSFFLGTHDFKSFSALLDPDTSTTRTIERLDIKNNYPFIDLEFEAESFLRNQIRIIAGTLVQVGRGKIGLDQIIPIFEAKDRTKAGPTLSGAGLYLMDVKY